MRETFPYDSAPAYLIFDRVANFNKTVVSTVKSFGIKPKRTAFQSPWQNGVAERWVGNCRWDLLDHVIVVNKRHLKRLMTEYVRYYHEDRTHLALEKERLPIVQQQRVRMRLAGSYPCRDWVACIIATISLPEPWLQAICNKLKTTDGWRAARFFAERGALSSSLFAENE